MHNKRTRKNIFLPKWQRFFVLPILFGVWSMITWLEFFSQSEDKMGLVGYSIMSGVLLLVGIMIWLMTSGKLPAYIVEESMNE